MNQCEHAATGVSIGVFDSDDRPIRLCPICYRARLRRILAGSEEDVAKLPALLGDEAYRDWERSIDEFTEAIFRLHWGAAAHVLIL